MNLMPTSTGKSFWRPWAARWALRSAVPIIVVFSGSSVAAQRPPSLTRQWVIETFLSAIDVGTKQEEDREAQQWRRVGRDPRLVDILVEIASDGSLSHLVRGNAMLRLGATQSPSAHAALVRFLHQASLPGDLLVNALTGVADGFGADSITTYRELASVLNAVNPHSRRIAAYALGEVGTARAHGILRERLRQETHPSVTEMIRQQLGRPVH